MTDPNFYMVMALATLAGLGMVTGAGLAGWRGWLALKRQELSLVHPGETASAAQGNAGARIEIADLKERIRKLEAIAAGVDL
ncbi:hypothetical protein [Sphingomonas sp.]|jgi:hypothetical protein|uniref:hypothetical protein n=1 Tax=Sphingomonas sp. TaxID=28214 RepID=UPI000BD305F8|nr:hypothetical protein [Sphingomonas sp.]MBA4762170.1 hypothetical protein [Sphingomonas sp.]OYX48721.1 MAG: hypothetical protein B7Y97_10375 [Sphingomonas sp. 32-66-10]